MPAKVLIVDDHPAVREGLAERISSQPDLKVCGQAADMTETMQLVAATCPDVVVVDIQLKTGNGLELVERIKAYDPSIRILVWSMYPDALYARHGAACRSPGIHQQGTHHPTYRGGHSPRPRRQDLPW